MSPQTRRTIFAELYRNLFKPIAFCFDAEFTHTSIVALGEFLGKHRDGQEWVSILFGTPDKRLQKKLHGMTFPTPIGLSAGFDYEARLMNITPSVGFGFHTIGTITNRPYVGNARPMLGRLPKSKSLLVNKGFKNPGADAIIDKLTNRKFAIPMGISIGRTNDAHMNQTESVKDIVQAFTKFEKAPLHHAYYELNISCPNLHGDVTFYDEKKLKQLLDALKKIHIKRPVFVKMPISQPDEVFVKLLETIAKSFPVGVIVGNLQQDRSDPAFDPTEIAQAGKGNFSGKSTYQRSNHLIELTKKQYGKRFTIIGCGGVFTPSDAVEKFEKGADLIQLITGMIFEGPQMIMDINDELARAEA